MADIDGMDSIALAQTGEGRAVDPDRARRTVMREYPGFAVREDCVGNVEVPFLEPDPGAVAVGYPDPGEDQALDSRPLAPKDEGRLALAGAAVEDGLAPPLRDIGDPAGLLDGAIAVAARRDPDRPAAAPDRLDRFLKGGEGLAGLGQGEGPGRLSPKRPCRGGRGEGEHDCDSGLHRTSLPVGIPSPVFTGEEGPAAKRWKVGVCTADSARPSPPKPSAWGPPLPRKAGEGKEARPPVSSTLLGRSG